MNHVRASGILLVIVTLLLTACGNLPTRHTGGGLLGSTAGQDSAPTADEIPADIENTPDAVPQDEPKSKSGNARTYTVFGDTYQVMSNASGFHQRGTASWYGKKFHGRKTASGERYNMYGMTAAHKTLPLPTYVRITNVDNDKTAVVKVNDRGPFHSERIIDVSYAAAAKLGILGRGTARVEIEVLEPGYDNSMPSDYSAPPAYPSPPPSELPEMTAVRSGYLQVAAYTDAINAVTLREELMQYQIGPVEIRINDDEGPVHRVMIGPFDNEAAAREVREQLARRSLSAKWVVE